MKLDRTREFGVICGGDVAACYVQDEILFDAAGNAITEQAEAPRKRMGRPPKGEVSDVDAQVEASLAG